MSTTRKIAPALALAVLAPGIAEVLSGATRLSYLFAYIPEIMVWGCGALLIRELVLRWRGGWISMLLLGLALSVAEEFVIQQTSIAPLPWLGTAPQYGRAWGVNWIYFLYMLGYESVWVVLVPVQAVYLLFPRLRGETWLRTRGMIISSVLFLLGSFIAWFSWTQRARTVVFHAAEYKPPVHLIVAGLASIALLFAAAWSLRSIRSRTEDASRTVSNPWLVGIAGFVLGLAWYALIVLVFVPNAPIGAPVVAACGIAWAALSFLLIRRWSSGHGWGELQRWALVFAAILVCMVGGFGGSSTWPRMDLIAKIVLNALAVLGLLALGHRIYREPRAG